MQRARMGVAGEHNIAIDKVNTAAEEATGEIMFTIAPCTLRRDIVRQSL